MTKKLIFAILGFFLLITSCRNEETFTNYETQKQELISKSLWKEDMVYIKNVKKVFEINFDQTKFYNDFGFVSWNYAMTFGHFDESFLRVPIIKDDNVVSVMQVVRNKKTDKVHFSHTEDNESIKFFKNLIFSKRPLKPLKDSAYRNSNPTGRAYWTNITTCTSRTLIVGCVYSGGTEGDCIPITSTTTTCTTTSVYINDYSDPNNGYNPPDEYNYDGTRPSKDMFDDPETPCDKIKKFGESQKTKDLMNNLKNETKSDREKGYTLKDNSGTLNENYFEGTPGENYMDVDVSDGVNAIIHSHYTGLLSIFSPDDIFVIAAAYKGGYIKDTQNFVLGVVTDSGTQYYMVIDDLQKFSTFSDQVLINGFNIYKNMYKRLGKISENNSPALNEYNFLNYLDKNNTGLKILEGSEDMNTWKKLSKGENNEILKEECL